MSKTDKWAGVFEAHPEVTEIHVGVDEVGNEQAFLNKGEAQNFVRGKDEKVTTVKRPLDKAAADKAEAAAKKEAEAAEKAAKEAEAAAKKEAEAAEKAAKEAEAAAKKGQ
jgi:hypothetical protein